MTSVCDGVLCTLENIGGMVTFAISASTITAASPSEIVTVPVVGGGGVAGFGA